MINQKLVKLTAIDQFDENLGFSESFLLSDVKK